MNPHLIKAFRQWERTNWKFMFQLPEFISKNMMAGRDEIIHTFVLYFRLPPEERKDCGYFMKPAEKMVRDLGCNEQHMAKIFMLQLWASVLPQPYKKFHTKYANDKKD